MTSERSSEARPLPTHDSVVHSKLDDSLVIQLYFLLESLVQITCLVVASATSTAGAPGGCGGWCHLPPCWGRHQPSVTSSTSSSSSSLSQSLQDVMKSSEAFFFIAFATFIAARATALCSAAAAFELKITQSTASLLLLPVNLLQRLASKVSSVTVKLPAAIVLLLQQQKARAADLTITDCFEPMRKWKNYCYSTSQLCMITKVLKVASSYNYSYSYFNSSSSNYSNYSVATQCSNFVSAFVVSANQLCTDICLSSSYGCRLLVSAV